MIVQLLISGGGKLELSQLPEEMQMLLARELDAIRLIDRDTFIRSSLNSPVIWLLSAFRRPVVRMGRLMHCLIT